VSRTHVNQQENFRDSVLRPTLYSTNNSISNQSHIFIKIEYMS